MLDGTDSRAAQSPVKGGLVHSVLQMLLGARCLARVICSVVSMRTYSTGMCVRLSFAIAFAVQPKILVLDEMIAAGDAAFAAKVQRRIQEIVSGIEILILATEAVSIVRTKSGKPPQSDALCAANKTKANPIG